MSAARKETEAYKIKDTKKLDCRSHQDLGVATTVEVDGENARTVTLTRLPLKSPRSPWPSGVKPEGEAALS